MAGALDDRRQLAIGKVPRLEPVIDALLQLHDRQPIGINGVPQPDETQRRRRGIRRAGWARPPQHLVEEFLQVGLVTRPVALEGELHVTLELAIGCARDEAHAVNEADEDADREGATAEPEQVDVVARPVVAAQESIELLHVALQAQAHGAAEQGQRLEAVGPDAIVVDIDLVTLGEVKRLADAPDVGLEELGRAVSRPIGQDHDILSGHGPPLHAPRRNVASSLLRGQATRTRAPAAPRPARRSQGLLNPLRATIPARDVSKWPTRTWIPRAASASPGCHSCSLRVSFPGRPPLRPAGGVLS